MPESELPRVVPLVEGGWESYLAALPPSAPVTRLVAPNRGVWTTASLAGRPGYLMADLPACGTMTAPAAARMYAALLAEVEGVRLLPQERVARAAAIAVEGRDRMLARRHAKGLGYFLAMPEMGGAPSAFGHHGSGGGIAFADRARPVLRPHPHPPGRPREPDGRPPGRRGPRGCRGAQEQVAQSPR
ncbi:hypothetical protein ACWGDE_05475 [Streptomyces sp. NPDC054956]